MLTMVRTKTIRALQDLHDFPPLETNAANDLFDVLPFCIILHHIAFLCSSSFSAILTYRNSLGAFFNISQNVASWLADVTGSLIESDKISLEARDFSENAMM